MDEQFCNVAKNISQEEKRSINLVAYSLQSGFECASAHAAVSKRKEERNLFSRVLHVHATKNSISLNVFEHSFIYRRQDGHRILQ